MHSKHAPRGHRNHLAAETSPYLLQHADNPVDWYPWAPEALAKARAERQADPAVDRLFGLPLVPRDGARIVRGPRDRGADERAVREHQGRSRGAPRPRPHLPDRAPGAEPGGGGWPLTMFLAPQTQRPFFGGTYFPHEPRYGMPAFRACWSAWREFYTTRARRTAGARRQAGRRCSASCCRRRTAAPRRCRARCCDGARHAAARIRRTATAASATRRNSRTRRTSSSCCALARRSGRGRRARPAGALHGDAHADAHGRRRPLRPARRRLLPLLRRPVLDDSALREDAVRQRPAARRIRRRRGRHRRGHCSAASPRKPPTGCCATCEQPDGRLLLDARCGFRRPRGQVLRLAPRRGARTCSSRTSTPCSRARFGLDRDAEFRGPVAPARVQVDRRRRPRSSA